MPFNLYTQYMQSKKKTVELQHLFTLFPFLFFKLLASCDQESSPPCDFPICFTSRWCGEGRKKSGDVQFSAGEIKQMIRLFQFIKTAAAAAAARAFTFRPGSFRTAFESPLF
jgi:hypothetical protein